MVRGYAKSSSIKGLVTMGTSEAHFASTSLQNIDIKQSVSNSKVYLEAGTVVNGSIVFQGNNGSVFESGGSKVLGNVTGGKIVKQ